ncbi:hypothetical protein F4X10_02705 [Candidatus Poribacteria bacterium]|nr:hypothetical protein [Candidatus Poribacteria bacterium]
MRPTLLLMFVFLLINADHVAAAEVTGTISGKVLLDRDPPALPEIVVDKSVDFCGETLKDRVLVVEDRGIQGAVVSLEWEGAVAKPEKPAQLVELQSRGCRFHPRIQATRLGNYLTLQSGDEIIHNPHGWWNDKKTVFNITLLNPNHSFKRKLKWTGIYRVECDTHTWMKAYILVFGHPYYTLTDASGTFRLENVPVGSYTLRVWHEILGEQRARVVVKPDESVEQDFLLPLVDKRRKELIPKTVSPWLGK